MAAARAPRSACGWRGSREGRRRRPSPLPGRGERPARPLALTHSLTTLVRISWRRGEALASTTLLLTSFPSTGFNNTMAAAAAAPQPPAPRRSRPAGGARRGEGREQVGGGGLIRRRGGAGEGPSQRAAGVPRGDRREGG